MDAINLSFLHGDKQKSSAASKPKNKSRRQTMTVHSAQSVNTTKETFSPPPEKQAKTNIPPATGNPSPSVSHELTYASSSSSEDESNDMSLLNNQYTQRPPSDGMFHDNEIVKFFDSYRTANQHMAPIRTATNLRERKFKFRKSPTNKLNYCQFQYKHAPALFLVTNGYGIFTTNSEDFTQRTVIHDIKALQPKHRVSMLVPTVDYWWNKESRELMKEFIEHFVNDLKSLAQNTHFCSALERFSIKDVPSSLQLFRNKLLHATKSINGKQQPAVFGFRIYNTNSMPSKISVPLGEIKGKQIELQKWKKLVTPAHLHTMMFVQVHGFKITRSGFTLDMSVEAMFYQRAAIIDNERSCSSFIITKNSPYVVGVADSSSSDDDEVANNSGTFHGQMINTNNW